HLRVCGAVSIAPSVPGQGNRDAEQKTAKYAVGGEVSSGGMPALMRADDVVPDARGRGGRRRRRAAISSAGRAAPARPGPAGRRRGPPRRGAPISPAGRHAHPPPGPAGLRSVLRRETLPLHVAPELLGHLGWTDRLRAQKRFQAVRGALDTHATTP